MTRRFGPTGRIGRSGELTPGATAGGTLPHGGGALTVSRVPSLRTLVLVDACAAAGSGGAQLALSGWLAPYLGLSVGALASMGAVGLGYAAFGAFLRLTDRCRAPFIPALIAANLGYAGAIASVLAVRRDSLTPLGLGYLCVESLGVLALALWERGVWRSHAPSGRAPDHSTDAR